MIEIYYSLGLISAAAIFQIIVKFTLNRREKATLLQLEQQQRRMSASSSSLTEMDVASAEALEGDEPAVFFQLLSQTGSEMLMVRQKETFGGLTALCTTPCLAYHSHLVFCILSPPLSKSIPCAALVRLIPTIPDTFGRSRHVQSSRSIETIVRERMDSDEAETVPILATSHTDGSDETPEVGLQQH